MKRLILILCICCMTLCSYSQSTYMRANQTIDISVHIGQMGVFQKEMKDMTVYGMSTTIYGLYIDVLFNPLDHYGDTRYESWRDENAVLVHLGYQIPITSFLRIIPMAGYAKQEFGYTDGQDWRLTKYGVRNRFTPIYKEDGFDYGGQMVFNINCGNGVDVNLSGTLTRYCIYGGIGLSVKLY